VSPELRQECIEVVEALVSVIEGRLDEFGGLSSSRALTPRRPLLAELKQR
jgi:hypothetical protein